MEGWVLSILSLKGMSQGERRWNPYVLLKEDASLGCAFRCLDEVLRRELNRVIGNDSTGLDDGVMTLECFKVECST
eukprot:CAMPEP_0184686098 /NCGR_PEP_ID=MMETSP0312-20130426/21303_1 /TAXON_ID=31354 /ORGANISM="Compsopogon coeruleus, Strain SAG 36.94" /LENGTH=75 /DNA_ID=CAMNT_0027140857 /DNA_START=507 /DNA_END=734 /DNA_ORIENTATION=+